VYTEVKEGRQPLGKLRIPDRFKPGLQLLAKIPSTSYEEILTAGSHAPSTFATNRELAAWIASEVPSLPEADVAKIIGSLTSLYRLRLRDDVSSSKLAADVAIAASEFIANLGPEFEKRLATLLPLQFLNVTSVKAKELQIQGEKTLCDSKILTDIRPVFGESVGESPDAAIIIHTLKLGFHDSGSPSHRDIYISLDSDDISSLKKALERAEEKERSLRLVLEQAKIQLIDLQ
jgi:hypothetical protein